MAIIDALAKFAEDLDITGTTGTALEGDVIDLGTARDIGEGYPLYLNLVWTEALDSADDTATVTIKLASDESASIATDGSASEHLVTDALGVGAATAVGKTYSWALPLEGVAYERYLGILVVTETQTSTAGKFTAFISPTPFKSYTPYPEGDN